MADDLESGTALAAWLVAHTTITELVRAGVMPQARAAELIDNAAFSVEEAAGAADAPSYLLATHARLIALHQAIRHLPTPTKCA